MPTIAAVAAAAAGATQPSHGTLYQLKIEEHTGGRESTPPDRKRSRSTTIPAPTAMATFAMVEVPCFIVCSLVDPCSQF